jgi:PPOX class probable FMN-dependent enzyme
MADTENTDSGWPAWLVSLKRALQHEGKNGPHFVQLATMGEVVYNRTVVWRGFFSTTASLMFATDCRSRKIRQIEKHPYAAVCWYFDKMREQFRFSGKIRIIDGSRPDRHDNDARQTLWTSLSDGVKEQFYWPEPGEARSGEINLPPSKEKPPSCFCLLVLSPAQVDHLDLRFTPHKRTIHTLQDDETWTEREVNP